MLCVVALRTDPACGRLIHSPREFLSLLANASKSPSQSNPTTTQTAQTAQSTHSSHSCSPPCTSIDLAAGPRLFAGAAADPAQPSGAPVTVRQPPQRARSVPNILPVELKQQQVVPPSSSRFASPQGPALAKHLNPTFPGYSRRTESLLPFC